MAVVHADGQPRGKTCVAAGVKPNGVGIDLVHLVKLMVMLKPLLVVDGNAVLNGAVIGVKHVGERI